MTVDQQWGNSTQKVKPFTFIETDNGANRALLDGTKLAWRRIITAYAMVSPHLYALVTGKSPLKVEDFEPTVENVSIVLKHAFGWKKDDISAFKFKIWGPTRPVAHIALMSASHMIPELKRRIEKAETTAGPTSLDAWFPSNSTLYSLLLEAEEIRLKLPQLKQFRIKEEDTIKFVAV
jgi:hypothetical protein